MSKFWHVASELSLAFIRKWPQRFDLTISVPTDTGAQLYIFAFLSQVEFCLQVPENMFSGTCSHACGLQVHKNGHTASKMASNNLGLVCHVPFYLSLINYISKKVSTKYLFCHFVALG